jgi:hypothetical protein
MEYNEFLKQKAIVSHSAGFDATIENKMLFDWQSDIVKWALKKGRCSIFADCGLGKTPMQLEWAQQVSDYTKKPVLILAPLAVAKQTMREGVKFGIGVTVCRTQSDVKSGVNITNYEMLQHFKPSKFSGIVLDESSILKHKDSKTRILITDEFYDTPYKLCCTATPAPNDYMELGTHSEFLGIMKQTEMLATFFLHDGGDTSKWRLKGHAESAFFAWVASWGCCMTRPQDLGYDQCGYDLPPLLVHEVIVKSDDLVDADGQIMMFASVSQTLQERRGARRNSTEMRVEAAAKIANETNEQVLVWCDLNYESDLLSKSINGAVEVKGADNTDYKAEQMERFSLGNVRALVSKPSIAGWGMNWQQCSTMIFVGLSDSFEAYYQAVRRCWRFGQKKPVNVYIVISDAEGAVKLNIERKQRDAQRMTQELIKHTSAILAGDIKATVRMTQSYFATEFMQLPTFTEETK